MQEKEPQGFWQGDTVAWSRTLDDYSSADGWALEYYFSRKDDVQTLTGVGQADGSWVMTIPPATSAQYLAGEYRWQSRVSKSGEVYTVGTGRMDIAPSLDAAIETRSNARVILDAIEAVLVGKATKDQAKITIGGQSLDRFSWSDLNTARGYYRSLVNREDDNRRVRDGRNSRAYVQGIF